MKSKKKKKRRKREKRGGEEQDLPREKKTHQITQRTDVDRNTHAKNHACVIGVPVVMDGLLSPSGAKEAKEE